MDLSEFLSILDANRKLLGTKLAPGVPGTYCPLHVVMLARCDEDVHYRHLYDPWTNQPINPLAATASDQLKMPEAFVDSIANAWDSGVFYGWDYDEADEGFCASFAGFLVSISLRPWSPQLTAG